MVEAPDAGGQGVGGAVRQSSSASSSLAKACTVITGPKVSCWSDVVVLADNPVITVGSNR